VDFGWDAKRGQRTGGPEPNAAKDGWIAQRRDRHKTAAPTNNIAMFQALIKAPFLFRDIFGTKLFSDTQKMHLKTGPYPATIPLP